MASLPSPVRRATRTPIVGRSDRTAHRATTRMAGRECPPAGSNGRSTTAPPASSFAVPTRMPIAQAATRPSTPNQNGGSPCSGSGPARRGTRRPRSTMAAYRATPTTTTVTWPRRRMGRTVEAATLSGLGHPAPSTSPCTSARRSPWKGPTKPWSARPVTRLRPRQPTLRGWYSHFRGRIAHPVTPRSIRTGANSAIEIVPHATGLGTSARTTSTMTEQISRWTNRTSSSAPPVTPRNKTARGGSCGTLR